jgi:hypothetical protein
MECVLPIRNVPSVPPVNTIPTLRRVGASTVLPINLHPRLARITALHAPQEPTRMRAQLFVLPCFVCHTRQDKTRRYSNASVQV